MNLYFLILLAFLALLPAVAQANDAEVLRFLKRHVPEIHKACLHLRDTDKLDYENALEGAAEAKVEFERVVKFSKTGADHYLKMYRFDFDIIGKSDEWVLSDDAVEKKRLEADLRQLIGKSFDHWVAYERAKLEKLESDLAEARRDFESAAGSKKKVVEADLQSILEDSSAYQKEKKQKLNRQAN